MSYEVHEFAEIFPMMSSKEFSELKRDISDNGQQEAVIIYDNKILDGKNRYKACLELGIEVKTRVFSGDNPLQYVMSTNLQRRHLTESQKAVVGRRYKRYYGKFAKERKEKGTNQYSLPELVLEGSQRSDARDEAGEVVGVSGRYIDMAEEVINKKPEMEQKKTWKVWK